MSRTVLVTGASIGLALSRRLARDGHHVVGVARRQVEAFPGTFVALDLGDTAATGAALANLAGRFAIDGGVNNVGLVRPQRLGEIDLPALDDVMRVNLHPAVQAVLPGMRKRGWGRVITVSSLIVLGAVDRIAYRRKPDAGTRGHRTWMKRTRPWNIEGLQWWSGRHGGSASRSSRSGWSVAGA